MPADKRESYHEGFSSCSVYSGFLKIALLKIISEEDSHGYGLIRKIEEITDMSWKPSPGSIYPALQELEERGLIVKRAEDRKIVYSITDKGREVLQKAQEHIKTVVSYLKKLFPELDS